MMPTSLTDASDAREFCTSCGVTYRPRLTRGTCPVCDASPYDAPAATATEAAEGDPDARVLSIVIAATVLNVLVLLVVALAVALL